MNIIYLLLPFALLLGGSFLAAFVWGASEGQFDDLETPAHRIFLPDLNTDQNDREERSSCPNQQTKT